MADDDGLHRRRLRRPRLAGRIRYGGEEASLVFALLIASVALLVFATLTDQVIEGETGHFDRAVLLGMRQSGNPTEPWGPRWFEQMMRDVTALGGTALLTLFTLFGVLYLWLAGKGRVALFLIIAVVGGVVLSSGLKAIIERPRPEIVPHSTYVVSSSYPSGHSMMSTVVYLTVGLLLARVQPRRRLKIYLVGLSIFITVIVGISRVYLGVHWPTDVLAGWAAGSAWALFCWFMAIWLLLPRGGLDRPRAGAQGTERTGREPPASSWPPERPDD